MLICLMHANVLVKLAMFVPVMYTFIQIIIEITDKTNFMATVQTHKLIRSCRNNMLLQWAHDKKIHRRIISYR